MILVDVYVPSLDREYNFSLNENVSLSTLREEVVEMIGQKEQTQLVGDIGGMTFLSKEKEGILPENSTLAGCGIKTGALLYLV